MKKENWNPPLTKQQYIKDILLYSEELIERFNEDRYSPIDEIKASKEEAESGLNKMNTFEVRIFWSIIEEAHKRLIIDPWPF